MIRLYTSIILFIVFIMACKSSRTPPLGAETISNDAPIPWVDDTPSKYDEINLPIFQFDSLLIYRKAQYVLKSTNSLNQNSVTSYYSTMYKVKETNFVFVKRYGASDLKEEMENIERIFLESITVVKPASLVRDDSVKTDYSIELYLAVSEREVLLSMCGVEGNCYLKYSFNRPL